MPEQAEVVFYRRRWEQSLGQMILRVALHPAARVFRGCPAAAMSALLPGAVLQTALAHGKQMLFHFAPAGWLGIHLGMSGELLAGPSLQPDRHDHLVLHTPATALVFRDPRMFGRIRFDPGPHPPAWWLALPPEILSDQFTLEAFTAALQRRKNSPLKAILLDQSLCPGIGNWMADEILWRARLHPENRAGHLQPRHHRELFTRMREVCQDALTVIGNDWGTPPDDWLFNHRWKDGGTCPRTGKPLVRRVVGGRTTCFSPTWQRTIRSQT